MDKLIQSLAPIYLITGADPNQNSQFLRRVTAVLDKGVQMIQLRAPELTDFKYLKLAEQLYQLCESFNGRLLLNRDLQIIKSVARHGVHLNTAQLTTFNERPGLPGEFMGASCHNLNELIQAVNLQLDYVLLSPVKKTQSHPEVTPLGWSQFASLAKKVSIPVYALGGMLFSDLNEALKRGACGIAMLSGLWSKIL